MRNEPARKPQGKGDTVISRHVVETLMNHDDIRRGIPPLLCCASGNYAQLLIRIKAKLLAVKVYHLAGDSRQPLAPRLILRSEKGLNLHLAGGGSQPLPAGAHHKREPTKELSLIVNPNPAFPLLGASKLLARSCHLE